MIATLDFEIDAHCAYRLTATLDVQGPSSFGEPALLTCKFHDAQGQPVTTPPTGFLVSDLYGAHVRLGVPGAAGTLPVAQIITPPAGAVAATLTLHHWRARDVSLSEPLEIAPYTAPAAPPTPDTRRIWDYDGPSSPGDVHEVCARFSRALAPREIVAAVRFTDATGTKLTPDGQTATSDEVGHFQYLAPTPEGTGCTRFHAPAETDRISVTLFRWVQDPTLTLDSADVVSRLARPDVIGTGTLALPAHTDCIFEAKLSVSGPDPALVAMTFFDADQHVVDQPAPGLQRDARYEAFAQVTPDALDRYDGALRTHLTFTPPPKATSLRWFVLQPGGDTYQLQQDPALHPLPPTSAAPWIETTDTLKEQLARLLPEDPTDAHMHRSGHTHLARTACPVNEDGWLRLSGTVARAAGGLDHAKLTLRVRYLDAAQNVLPHDSGPGFGHSANDGLHRSLCAVPTDESATAAQIDTPVFCPDGAAFVVIDIVACHSQTDIALTTLNASPQTALEVCGSAPLARMTRPQLVQMLDIAEHAGDLLSCHATLQALSAVDPDTKGYAYRARILAETLHVLDPLWLPTTGPDLSYTPQENHVLHLAGASSDPLPLVHQQTWQGGSPAVILRSDSPLHTDPSVTLTSPVAQAILPGATGQDLAPADQIEAELRQHSAFVRQQQPDLLHVHTALDTCDTALMGMALAKTCALPLLIDLPALPPPAPTALHARQRARCLTAAECVLVPEGTDQTGLGVPTEQVVTVPYAVDPDFEDPAPDTDVSTLRRDLGLHHQTVIGYVCTEHPSDHAWLTLLRTGLHDLSIRHPGLTVLLIGPAPSRSAHARLLQTPDIRLFQADPEQVSDMRVWYALCTVVLADHHAALRQGISIALKAMAQGVPLLLTRDLNDLITGPDRTARLAVDAAQRLSDSLDGQLARVDSLRTRAQQAQHWVRTERRWQHRSTTIAHAYDLARVRYSERGR